ncbi:MAG: hypothetical protein ACI9TH_004538 [Kiritimatiellia bacterium]|jgi:hypothetical protein
MKPSLNFLLITCLFAPALTFHVQAKESAWTGLQEPHETFEAYVQALKKSDFDKAVAYIYIPDRAEHEANVKEGLPKIAATMKSEDWRVKIVKAAKEGEFAAIIYITRPEKKDYEPVLMMRKDNHWYLHNYRSSGHLRNILEEADLAQAQEMVAWGKQKMQELKNN